MAATEQPTEPFPFEDLPPELRLLILDTHRPLIPIFAQLSKKSYEIASRLYVKALGSEWPSVAEIGKYVESRPTRLGLFSLCLEASHLWVTNGDGTYGWLDFNLARSIEPSDDGMDRRYVDIFGRDGEFWLFALNDDLEDTQERRFSVSGLKQRILEYFNENGERSIPRRFPSCLVDHQLDLLSTYRILSERLGCHAREAGYAKRLILERVDAVYQFFQADSSVIAKLGVFAFFNFQLHMLDLIPSIRSYDSICIVYHRDGRILSEDWPPLTFEEAQHQLNTMWGDIPVMYHLLKQEVESW